LRTPNIDALARKGTRFPLAFATVSSCSPSRAVIYTGLLTHHNGQYQLAHGFHNGSLPTGGSYRRSICVDYMYYNEDGTIQKIVQTTEGVKPVNHP
jgi:hypothetical protein